MQYFPQNTYVRTIIFIVSDRHSHNNEENTYVQCTYEYSSPYFAPICQSNIILSDDTRTQYRYLVSLPSRDLLQSLLAHNLNIYNKTQSMYFCVF